MALPSIEMPTAVPDWRVVPHDFTLAAPLASVQFVTGAPRRRRSTTGSVRSLQAEMQCTQAQAQALRAWFEDDLEAGSLPFAARVLASDGTREWWHARFSGPLSWSGVASSQGPLWRVSAALRLQGQASETAPA
jgi:hypothetical protein